MYVIRKRIVLVLFIDSKKVTWIQEGEKYWISFIITNIPLCTQALTAYITEMIKHTNMTDYFWCKYCLFTTLNSVYT